MTLGRKLILGRVATLAALPILKGGWQAPSYWHRADALARRLEASGPGHPASWQQMRRADTGTGVG